MPDAFSFPAETQFEYLRDSAGPIVGVIVRERKQLCGAVEIMSAKVERRHASRSVCGFATPRLLKRRKDSTRDDALLSSLVSTHTVLGVQDGRFVSLLAPPEPLSDLAASCKNVGTWPVLVGEEGQCDTLLSSPIILYDYPQIAPESAGDLFDGTEIDEILSLRIMTLTDDEKREMSQSDERARAHAGAHRDHAGGTVHEAARSPARTAPAQGGDPMNEWEWQLLEEKTPLDHLEISGVEVQDGKPRASASPQGRRRDGYRARRTGCHHRVHRAGLRGQEPRLRGSR